MRGWSIALAGVLTATALAGQADTQSLATRYLPDPSLAEPAPDSNPRKLPPIWKVTFAIHDEAIDATKGAAKRVLDYTNMGYKVRAQPDMEVEAAGLTGAFKYVLESTQPGLRMEDVWTGNGNVKLPDAANDLRGRPAPGQSLYGPQLLLGRTISVRNCQKLLDVRTTGSMRMYEKPNSYVISQNLRWTPTVSVTSFYNPKLVHQYSVIMNDAVPILTLTAQEVPYDFEALITGRTDYLLAAYDSGGFRTILDSGIPRRTISYTISREKMELKYGDPNVDLRDKFRPCDGCTGNQPHYIQQSLWIPEIAERRQFRFLHGNVDVRLLIAGDDVGQSPRPGGSIKRQPGAIIYPFNILRLRRDWTFVNGKFKLDESEQPEMDVVSGWHLDPSTPGNFRDMPGRNGEGLPSDWTPKLTAQEFLVGVQGFPEFGFLYYLVAIETKKGEYRVSQAPATNLKAAGFCRRLNTPGMHEQPKFGSNSWVEAPEW